MDYKNRYLQINNTYVPFNDYNYIEIPKRSVKPFDFRIANPEVQQGYLPRIEPSQRIFMGEALISNNKGKGFLNIFNTTDETVELVVPSLTLQSFTILAKSVDSENPTNSSNKATTDWKDCNEIPPTQSSSYIENPESSNFLYAITLNPPMNAPEKGRVEEIIKLLRLNHLHTEEKEHMINLVKQNASQFFLPGDALHGTEIMKHAIRTVDDTPINVKQYRFPLIHKEEINKQVEDLLQNNIIEHSVTLQLTDLDRSKETRFSRKQKMADGNRLQSTKRKTIGDGYPLPNITDILDQLGKARYFTTLDLASGFHQIPMHEQDAHKTAFKRPIFTPLELVSETFTIRVRNSLQTGK